MALTITHTTPADGTFSATGAAAWDATHTFSVTGTSGQVQFNNAGDLAGDAGLTFDSTNKTLTITSGTQTVSTPALDMTQTWNNAATTFTGYKLNVTDTASNASSLLMDLQVGGATKFYVDKVGRVKAINKVLINTGASETGIQTDGADDLLLKSFNVFTAKASATRFVIPSTSSFCFSGGTITGSSPDAFIVRRAIGSIQLGAADAAAPVAQTLGVQSVVAGTSNTPGQNFTIAGSQGTGTGVGGSIVFQVAPARGSGTAQNTLLDILTLSWTAANGTIAVFNAIAVFGNLQISSNRLQNYGGVALALNPIGNNVGVGLSNPSQGLTVKSTYGIAWDNGSGTADTILTRDAANTLAQRNGVNAQTQRLYGTYTDASNYRRLAMTVSAGGVAEIKPEGAGTGASGNVLHISGLPTSNPGPGILWNNAGTPAIGT